jgi:hypothetical protein
MLLRSGTLTHDPLLTLTNDRFLVAHILSAIVSRLCTNAKLTEHIVDSVDNRLRLVQLNLVV